MVKFFDAHNHLQDYPGPAETEEALREADAEGVEFMLCSSASPSDWQKVLALAAAHKNIVPCFGLHPWFVRRSAPDWLQNLEEFLRRAPACVGEIGLDGEKETDTTLQEEVFTAQLKLAKKLRRPACVHCVNSWGRILEIIKKENPGTFMLHSYGGPAEMIEEFSSLGAYFSFSGAVMDAKRKKLREALLAAPSERLLFESESPKPDAKGRRTGPGFLPEVVSAAADILCRSTESLAALSHANGIKFLGEIVSERK
ncbi:MAG TPA: hypothetical protein DCL44_10450 [Elusimicrobia bacterium]|nr:hypothetical protein [Elusimicrobiota bacterium]